MTNQVRLFLSVTLLCVAASGQLSGTYTVGTGGSFPDLSTAIAALNASGVGGPVTFNVSGNQTGPWTITNFAGGAANAVVFNGGGTVALSGSLPVLTLNGCSNVTFSGFTATFAASGDGIKLDQAANACAFTGCTFLMAVTTSGTSQCLNFANAVNCRVEDSHFGGGYRAFNATGGSGCIIQRCRMLGGGWRISETAAPNFIFRNNFVYGNSNYGLHGQPGCAGFRVYNNSFYIVHSGTGTQFCTFRWYTSDNAEIVNNACFDQQASSPGFMLWCSGAFRPTVMNYNVYNLVGGGALVFASANQTLAGWQALGYDLQSTQANPGFANLGVTPPDLHITANSPCALAGATLAIVTDDYDGGPRVPPYDVGAHEITSNNLFSAITSGSGVGDLNMSLSMISPGGAEAYTLVSALTTAPLGSGPFFGIHPDAYTFAFLQQPIGYGDPLHYYVGVSGIWPSQPFVLGPGTLLLGGQIWDAVVVMFGPGFTYLGRSNVVRIVW